MRSVFEGKICFMQLIEHGFTVSSETICEFCVQVKLKCFIDSCYSGAASVTSLAWSSLTACCMVWTFVFDFLSSFGSDVSLSHRSPYKEGRVLCYKVCNPLVGFLEHVHVDTILIILLLVGIEEQIKTCQIRKRNKFSNRCALLVSQRFVKFEMQVTNFLLGDWSNCINWVEPGIQGFVLIKLFKAFLIELSLILDLRNFLNEACAHWENFCVGFTEIVRVSDQILFSVCLSARFCICHWSEGSHHEVPTVEARCHLYAI